LTAYSLSPLAFLIVSLAVLRVTGHALPPLRQFALYPGLPALPLPLVFGLVLLLNGFGEELGWRGLALGHLQQRFGPVVGALLLGVAWASWHAPLFRVVDEYRAMGAVAIVFGFGLGICAGAVVLAHVLNRTGGSLLAVALWHTLYNLMSATPAGHGAIGGITTACVEVWAVLVLLLEWRRPLSRSRLLSPAALHWNRFPSVPP
jgi:membrane protease YdiL (CAAX protease family)